MIYINHANGQTNKVTHFSSAIIEFKFFCRNFLPGQRHFNPHLLSFSERSNSQSSWRLIKVLCRSFQQNQEKPHFVTIILAIKFDQFLTDQGSTSPSQYQHERALKHCRLSHAPSRSRPKRRSKSVALIGRSANLRRRENGRDRLSAGGFMGFLTLCFLRSSTKAKDQRRESR